VIEMPPVNLMNNGLPGRLTRDQLPASMGDLYAGATAGHAWRSTDAGYVVIDYVTPAESAAALLPSELMLLPGERRDTAIGRLWLASHRGGTFGRYNEVLIEIPCTYEGKFSLYAPRVYVDTLAPLAAGREVTGLPYQPGQIDVRSFRGQTIGSLRQDGRSLLCVRCTRGNRLVSLPFASTSHPVLPAPFDRTMPLPVRDGGRHGIPISLMTTRYIPAGIEPQHILSDCEWQTGTAYAADATIDYPPDIDPLAKLPVLEVLGALVFRGAMIVHGTTIVQDMA
jgi:acetoacetate decarboxylase